MKASSKTNVCLHNDPYVTVTCALIRVCSLDMVIICLQVLQCIINQEC